MDPNARRKRFVLVEYVPKFGYYALVFPNQGCHHYDDKVKALQDAALFRASLKERNIGSGDVRVIEADCYLHGDCCATIFSVEKVRKFEGM